ncbi:WYL domain-containing protein [Candidatus Binatia bacterium]|nr:WYL domain-containing protein [Candidatus Binatia bacterium]
MARIVHGLHQRPGGWSFDAIRAELDISERTLLRYVRACREELVDERERCLVEVVRRGNRRILRLAGQPAALEAEGNLFELLYLYFALTVFQFLEGTVIKESVDGLWKRILENLPRPLRLRLADFQLKFYAVPHMMKDYSGSDEVLDAITQGLLYQTRLRLRHRGLGGEEREHEVDPYTLMMYRGGLYLIARSHRVNKTVYFAVERIAEATRLGARFSYPRGYSPQKHIEGVFGIIDGPQTAVEILIRNRETAAYLSSRRIHPTQRFRQHRDGTTTLTMTVRGTAELVPWLVGLGDYVQVLRPAALRDRVHGTLAAAARLYTRTRPGAGKRRRA